MPPCPIPAIPPIPPIPDILVFMGDAAVLVGDMAIVIVAVMDSITIDIVVAIGSI